ncbi:DUF6090 family protein [Thalassobellus citreus]|uniref:DUF6090 family protein n=1 Tax=Thalassobellus citreus TaxID=3367752 RepID=UPI0037A65192
MIKFFRKIRQKTLTENKFRKYLTYAIGEIILVVIGILIALSINNWNEDRKATRKEIKILKELKNDLNTNIIELKETYVLTNKRQLSTVLILDYLKNRKPVDDSLKKAFENINMDGIFNIANTAYKYIESQGIDFLTNDSLRIRTTEMYELDLKNIHTRENKNWNIIDKELLPFMNEFFISSPTIDKSASFSKETINMPKDIESLRQNSSFNNVLIRLQSWLKLRIHWQQNTLTKLEQLILGLEKEINKLDN